MKFLIITCAFLFTFPLFGQDIFRISDIEGVGRGSNPRTFVPFKNGFIFQAFVGQFGGTTALYFDGNDQKVIPLKNEDTGEFLGGISSNTTELENHIYFRSSEGGQQQLYKFDGKVTKMVVVNTQQSASSPLELITFNDHIVGSFIADTIIGRAIYRIDPNDNVTQIDLKSEPGSFFGFETLTVFQDELIFAYNSEDFGKELFTCSTHFTVALMADLNPGTSSGIGSAHWGVANDLFFFEGQNDNSGRELWVYETGTTPSLININPSGSSDPRDMHAYNDRLFFVAAADGSDRQVYSTDGSDGAILLKDIDSGGSGINIDDIVTYNGRLYFNDRNDLWSSDGSEVGTRMDTTFSGLSHIVPTSTELVLFANSIYVGTGVIGAYKIVPIEGSLGFINDYLVNNDEIYLPYGTTFRDIELGVFRDQSIKQVANIETQKEGMSGGYAVHNGHLFYSEDSILYQSDGASTGTHMAYNFGSSLLPNGLMASLGDRLILSLSISDGGSANTFALGLYDPVQSSFELVDTIQESGQVNYLFEVASTIYFQARNSVYRYTSGESDAELVTFWDMDSGTYPHLVDGDDVYADRGRDLYLNDDLVVDFSGSNGGPREIIKGGDYIYFTAVNDGSGRELYAYHIPSKTLVSREFTPGEASTAFSGIIYYGNTLYVGLRESDNDVIYRLSGALVSQAPATSGLFVLPIIYDERVYFIGNSVESGLEVWRTNEAGDDYELAHNVNAGMLSSFPNNFFIHEGQLYFTALDDMGIELWRTDGAKDGLQRITDIYQGSPWTSPFSLKAFGETLAFLGSSVEFRRQLYIYEPCINGTTLNCATGDCSLASAVYPSTRGVILNDSYTLPLTGFATIKTGDDLQVNGKLEIERGARFTVYNEGCNQ